MTHFHIATEEEIRAGKVTDVYFLRTNEILSKKGINRRVAMEVFLKKFPNTYDWGVYAGAEEALRLLEGHPVDVWSLPEGTLFRENQPLMVIRGKYLDFGIFETALLGMLCQSSGCATRAARCRLAAGDKPLVSFGARRMHPSVAPMCERAAYIGGCDGVAAVKSAEIIGRDPIGTMPHALILLMGDTVVASKAFHEVIDPGINRVILIDTLQDEKFEAIRTAEALGKHLYGIRFDTPSSRRGNFRRLLEETRWELDIRGYSHVKIFVSGGVDEHTILDLSSVADAFGVGTRITGAPVLDYALDIVEIEEEKIAKRGKESGAKKLLRCPVCHRDCVVLLEAAEEPCRCGSTMVNLMRPMIRAGQITETLPTPEEIRRSVLQQLSWAVEGRRVWEL
ncbi:MAG: nicotinate phosphoribosyltransferase [Deltaproteobacteria bacterium]|nr:nicotinate phosphoribosyltransferase [Deltaproteobacteria bacterium]